MPSSGGSAGSAGGDRGDGGDSSGGNTGGGSGSGSGGSGGGSTSGGMSPDAREGSKQSGYGPGGSAPSSSSGMGSNSAIDASLRAAFGEVDTARSNLADSAAADSNSAMSKLKGFLANAVKTLAVKAVTGNTFAQAIETGFNLLGYDTNFAKSFRGYLDKGLTDSDALAATTSDTLSAIDAKGEMSGGDREAVNQVFAKTFADFGVDPVAGTPLAKPVTDNWDDFVSQYMGTPEGSTSMKEMMQGQADFMKGQVDEWKSGYQTATAKQAGLLDNLIEQSTEGTGMFSPVKFKLAGQDIAFVPRAQREQANQLAALGQTGLTNQQGYLDKALTNAPSSSPQAGNLAYLDSLQDMAGKDKGFNLVEDKIIADKAMQETGIKAEQESNEPGVLDYIKAVGSFF